MIKDNTNLMSGKGEWNEEDHPRDEKGRFTNGSGKQSIKEFKYLQKSTIIVKDDIEKNVEYFREQLEQVQNGTYEEKDNALIVGQTPKIFIEEVGFPNLPLCMTYEKAYLSVNHEGNIKGNYHNLGIDTLSQLPKKLQDPLYIFKSNNPKRIEAVVDLVDGKGHKVFAVVEMDTPKQVKGEFKHVNLVVTAFAPKEKYIMSRLNEEKILYKKQS